jgi:hypothetical protein
MALVFFKFDRHTTTRHQKQARYGFAMQTFVRVRACVCVWLHVLVCLRQCVGLCRCLFADVVVHVCVCVGVSVTVSVSASGCPRQFYVGTFVFRWEGVRGFAFATNRAELQQLNQDMLPEQICFCFSTWLHTLKLFCFGNGRAVQH